MTLVRYVGSCALDAGRGASQSVRAAAQQPRSVNSQAPVRGRRCDLPGELEQNQVVAVCDLTFVGRSELAGQAVRAVAQQPGQP
jgi:hypothetical protein